MYSLPHNNAAGMASNSLRHSCAAQPAKHTQFNICLPFGGRHSGFWQTHPRRAGSRFTTAGRGFLPGSLTGCCFFVFYFRLSKNSFDPPNLCCLDNTIKTAKIIFKTKKTNQKNNWPQHDSHPFNPAVWAFIRSGCETPPRALAFPSVADAPGLPEQSAGLTASAAQCHGVH